MASGSRRAIAGSFVATGAAGQQILTLLFTPKRIELLNVTTKGVMKWQESMPAGAGFKDADTGSGTEDMSYITTGGITQLETGFQVDTDSFFNASDVIHYWAEE